LLRETKIARSVVCATVALGEAVMGARIGFWTLVAATVALNAAIVGWSAPYISAQAGGAPIFDLRPLGYTFAEARAFLQALTPEGTGFYRAVQLRLDLLYPALLALSIGWALVWLMPRWKARAVVLVPPVFAMIFDYAENVAIHRMLMVGADGLTPELVAQASLLSQLKALSSTVSFSLLLVVMGLWFWRRLRARAAAPG
jgi:hypothetical protein